MAMTENRGIRVRRGTRQRWVESEQGKHFCQCGCEQPIQLRTEHFNVGIPQYIHGHNTRGQRRTEPPQATPCECGCEELATPGRRFISGHSRRGTTHSATTKAKMSAANSGTRNGHWGKRAHNWKGGRTKTAYGYIDVWAPDHPHAKSGRYVLEHRLLMERHLLAANPASPYLADGHLHRQADVHHVNGVKDDNRIENLVVMWKDDHARHHNAISPQAAYPAEWFDGAQRTLHLGVDTRGTSLNGVRSSLHRAARKRSLRAVVTQIDAEHFTFQALPITN
jgi:hypothetical protein